MCVGTISSLAVLRVMRTSMSRDLAGGALHSAGAHIAGRDGCPAAGHTVGKLSGPQAGATSRSAARAQRTGSDGHGRIRSWKVFPLLSACLNPID